MGGHRNGSGILQVFNVLLYRGRVTTILCPDPNWLCLWVYFRVHVAHWCMKYLCKWTYFILHITVLYTFLRTILNTSVWKRNDYGYFCLHILILYSNVFPFWVNISNVSYSIMKHLRIAYMSCNVSVSLRTTLVNVNFWSPEGDTNLCS